MSAMSREHAAALSDALANAAAAFDRLAREFEVYAHADPLPGVDFLPEPSDDDHSVCLSGCEAFAAEADRLVSKVLDGGAA